ncbi:gliding motility-associated C-terminal domain-containing protein [candidate division KSB1 bacterium]|nr:gliding motility-associated C-terminal domain-containing protein [candidate division KSB1 bacterium]
MKNKFILLISFLIVFSISDSITAGTIEKIIRFEKSDLQFSKIQQYDIIRMRELELSHIKGEPQLPVKLIHLNIPDGEKVTAVEIISVNYEILKQNLLLLPCQAPQALSNEKRELKLQTPDSEIYQSNDPYPQQVVSLLNAGKIQGKQIAGIAIYPMQYLPAQKKVRFYSEIQFRVMLENREPISKHSTSQPDDGYLKLTENVDLVGKKFSIINGESYPYIIITSKTMKPNFQPLADWKTQKGLRAKIVDINWIVSQNFPGRDEAERVRSFILYAYQNWDTKWVLLGGDINIVPHRTAFAMDCQFSNRANENHIPCDLYFSDLDGDWDANGNDRFGEISDKVDLFPEVYVGRASLDSPEEVNSWVNKILVYEKNPPLDFQKNLLFICQILWNTPYTDTGIGKNKIEADNLPPGFFNISKLYESSGNLNKNYVIQKINEGQNIINHAGHAWWSSMSIGNGSLGVSDMNSLANGNRTGTIFSIGCWAGAIDYNCVAEAYIAAPGGGGVAFIGNSRYGWGSPGNPGYGYSDRFDDKFFHFLFEEKCNSIGKAMALAKAFYAPFSQQENVYRWCMYQLNLLGDPEMPMWTDIPKQLSVEHPPAINIGNGIVTVTVTQNNFPVENTRVCLNQGETIYKTGITNSEGHVNLFYTTDNASEDVQITVTAANYLPYEDSISVRTDEPFLACSEIFLNDDLGNADGVLNPGETAYLSFTLKNYGKATAETLLLSLKSDTSALEILTGSVAIEYINGLDSVAIDKTFQIKADSTCSNGDVFFPQLTINAFHGSRQESLPVSIGTPVIELYDLKVVAENGTQLIRAGDLAHIFVYLKNSGLAKAENVQASIFTNNEYLTLPQKTLYFGDLTTQNIGVDSFSVSVSESCPEPYFPAFTLEGACSIIDSFKTSGNLAIGQLGYFDDLESGAELWELTDKQNNTWHLSNIRYHSEDFSWYCGNESDTSYADDNTSILLSPFFNLGDDAELTFWLWYDVAIYSKSGYEGDGVHVEFYDGFVWQELDFIGTGGALAPVLMGNDWLEYKYNLNACPTTNNARLKFKFVSDPFWSKYPAAHEGIYIDDIKVSCYGISSVKETEPKTFPEDFKLAQNYPNPFNGTTVINYKIPGSINNSFVQIQIYNTMGQIIKSLVNEQKQPGNYHVLWDGTNDKNEPVSSGIYFYLMDVKNRFREVKKLILLE